MAGQGSVPLRPTEATVIFKRMSDPEEGDGARLFFTMSGLVFMRLNGFPIYFKPEPGSRLSQLLGQFLLGSLQPRKNPRVSPL